MRDGAQAGPIPVVPWSQAITGHPPSGARPWGTMITPVSARGAPVALSERYMKRSIRPARRTAGATLGGALT